ncbi:MAG: hypothetical protein VW891_11465, partial [Novosphingobium sp.]
MQQVALLVAPVLGIAQPHAQPSVLPFHVLAAVEAAQAGAGEPQAATSVQSDAVPQQEAIPLPGGETDADAALIDGRRRPGFNKQLPEKVEQDNPGAVGAPPPEAFYDKYDGEGPVGDLGLDVALPDRWRIMSSLCPKKDAETGKKDRTLYTLFPKLEFVCHSQLDP